MRKIVIPVLEEKGAKSQISEHFGRAPYFTIVEIDESGEVTSLEIIPNTSEHFGGVGYPPERILALNPDAVITFGMGMRALNWFQQVKVAVLKTNSNTVEEIIEEYLNDELEELTEGCHHAFPH